MTFKPNPPRLITIVIAIVLLVVGAVGVLMPSLMNDAIKALPVTGDTAAQLRDLAHNEKLLFLCALASPLLLAIGSLLPRDLRQPMRTRSNHAPRFETIIVALVTTIVGVLGTFGKIIPTIAGFDSVTIGMWCYIAASVILLIGVFFRRF